jgi:hypothetical protein
MWILQHSPPCRNPYNYIIQEKPSPGFKNQVKIAKVKPHSYKRGLNILEIDSVSLFRKLRLL